jgi:hypothetical protein
LADVPSSLFPLAGSDLNDAEVIQALATSAAVLKDQLAEEQAYMRQCGTLVEDWISRLDDSSYGGPQNSDRGRADFQVE